MSTLAAFMQRNYVGYGFKRFSETKPIIAKISIRLQHPAGGSNPIDNTRPRP